jgi:hypothetical protein
MASPPHWQAESPPTDSYLLAASTAKPVNTLVRVTGLIGDHRVEIEAEAIVRAATSRR